MKIIIIQGEYMTLQQFLKIEDFISSGGESKYFLNETSVFVNQELEKRRGRKLYPNDMISINGKEYILK